MAFSRFSLSLLFTSIVLSIGIWKCGGGEVAGTSSGTENPEIVLVLESEAGVVLTEGSLSIYRPEQNVLLQPQSVQDIPIEGERMVIAVLDLLNLYKKPGSRLYSKISFNLLLHAAQWGAVVHRLEYESETGLLYQNRVEVDGPLKIRIAPLVNYGGFLRNENSTDTALAIYLEGTPFVTKMEGPRFQFKKIPRGKYNPFAITRDGSILALSDSLIGDNQGFHFSRLVDSLSFKDIPADSPWWALIRSGWNNDH